MAEPLPFKHHSYLKNRHCVAKVSFSFASGSGTPNFQGYCLHPSVPCFTEQILHRQPKSPPSTTHDRISGKFDATCWCVLFDRRGVDGSIASISFASNSSYGLVFPIIPALNTVRSSHSCKRRELQVLPIDTSIANVTPRSYLQSCENASRNSDMVSHLPFGVVEEHEQRIITQKIKKKLTLLLSVSQRIGRRKCRAIEVVATLPTNKTLRTIILYSL